MKRKLFWLFPLLGLLMGGGWFLFKQYRAELIDWYLVWHYSRAKTPEQRYKRDAYLGMRLGLGLPPTEVGKGIGHFILKNTTPPLKLTVPRPYITVSPNEPDGKIPSLYLTFYFPAMLSRQEMAQYFNNQQLRALEIVVFLQGKDRCIHCWSKQCLGPEFALFQGLIDTFQRKPPHDPVWEDCVRNRLYIGRSIEDCPPRLGAPLCLQNGRYEADLDLTAYESLEKPKKGGQTRKIRGLILFT
jgi:hypothetical protein